MKTKKTAASAVLLASLATVGALALSSGTKVADASSNFTEPAVGKVAVVGDWRQVDLPLDAYAQQSSARALVLRAEYALVATCMKTYGINFRAPAWDTAASDTDSHYRLYGLSDAKHAASFGYHPNESLPTQEATYSASLPAGYDAAFAGSDTGEVVGGRKATSEGCAGEARRAVSDTGSATATIEDASADAWSRAEIDSRVIAVFSKWSTCMKAAGYSYANPAAANNDRRWQENPISDLEKSVAVADVRCKADTNVLGVRMAVQSAYESALIAANPARFQAAADQLTAQVTAARLVALN